MSNQDDVKQLNSFLRGEISATETYRQVIEKAESPSVSGVLAAGHASHERRVRLLEDKIRALGGEPDQGAGAWGALTKAIQGGAKLFGLPTAIAVLEEGEDHGKKDYAEHVGDLSPTSQAFVRSELMSEQDRTHDSLAALKAKV